jgi:hypothetical protein
MTEISSRCDGDINLLIFPKQCVDDTDAEALMDWLLIGSGVDSDRR